MQAVDTLVLSLPNDKLSKDHSYLAAAAAMVLPDVQDGFQTTLATLLDLTA